MKKINICAARLLCGVVFSGCSSIKADPADADSKQQISSFDEQELAVTIRQGKELGAQLLTALKNKDYQQTVGLPIGDAKNQLTKERFDKLVEKLQTNGGIHEFAYLGDVNMKPYRRLLWKVSFDPQGKAAGLDMIFEMVIAKLDGKFKAVGFGFRH